MEQTSYGCLSSAPNQQLARKITAWDLGIYATQSGVAGSKDHHIEVLRGSVAQTQVGENSAHPSTALLGKLRWLLWLIVSIRGRVGLRSNQGEFSAHLMVII